MEPGEGGPIPSSSPSGHRTGVVYDERCLLHANFAETHNKHQENPGRIKRIWDVLHEEDLAQRCVRVHAHKLPYKQARLVHTKDHMRFLYSLEDVFQTPDTPLESPSDQNVGVDSTEEALQTIPKPLSANITPDGDTYGCHHSTEASRVSAGALVQLTDRVMKGDLKNGMAVIRPPGHHATPDRIMGFCLLNNVAITAQVMRERYGLKRILIVDWDIHHGNGTEDAFYEDPSVLYFSIHRYDKGTFYPQSGHLHRLGEGKGRGYNINVPLNGVLGDDEYIHAVSELLLPVAKDFNPELILVSAGFDSALGDFGDMQVTPAAYATITRMLMDVCPKVVVALEGGYVHDVIAQCTADVTRALLGETMFSDMQVPSPESPLEAKLWRMSRLVFECVTMPEVVSTLLPYWPCLASYADHCGVRSAAVTTHHSSLLSDLYNTEFSESDDEDYSGGGESSSDGEASEEAKSDAGQMDTSPSEVPVQMEDEEEETSATLAAAEQDIETALPQVTTPITVTVVPDDDIGEFSEGVSDEESDSLDEQSEHEPEESVSAKSTPELQVEPQPEPEPEPEPIRELKSVENVESNGVATDQEGSNVLGEKRASPELAPDVMDVEEQDTKRRKLDDVQDVEVQEAETNVNGDATTTEPTESDAEEALQRALRDRRMLYLKAEQEREQRLCAYHRDVYSNGAEPHRAMNGRLVYFRVTRCQCKLGDVQRQEYVELLSQIAMVRGKDPVGQKQLTRMALDLCDEDYHLQQDRFCLDQLV